MSEPVSDYVRFELLHGYPANVEAGEDVRILGRSSARWRLPGLDFWLFDDDLAAVLVYDSDGASSGSSMLDDARHPSLSICGGARRALQSQPL